MGKGAKRRAHHPPRKNLDWWARGACHRAARRADPLALPTLRFSRCPPRSVRQMVRRALRNRHDFLPLLFRSIRSILLTYIRFALTSQRMWAVTFPRLRGRGVVGRLLQGAESHLRAAGVRRIRIAALADNAGALRAYAKHGFDRYEVVMEKRVCA